MDFQIKSPFQPTGDQPAAIEKLVKEFKNKAENQVLLGVTGSGKTFTMANVIQQLQKPTLIIAHNKTLAAQLYQEFRDFFPDNAVSYFVSYYDYYQPEAYLPSSDTYIEKDSSINDEIDKLRLSSTTNLLTRKDVIVVASVSCIYNLGSPVEYGRYQLRLMPGEVIQRESIFLQLSNLQYERSETDLMRGTYRVRGDVIQIWPAYENTALKIETLDNTIESICWIDPISGQRVTKEEEAYTKEYILYPAKHYVLNPNTQAEGLAAIRQDLARRTAELKADNKIIEAFRLEQKVNYDIEMIENLGFVNGIENYSRYFDGRKEGEPPFTLLDYFRYNADQFDTNGFLTIIDESHMTLPQVRGMYNGDRARKETLVQYGFRLPSALDNRPLQFPEFLARNDQFLHVSATPAEWELSQSQGHVVEQVIRPTGLVDPTIELRPTEGQIEDLVMEILYRKHKGQRVLVTTLTKKMAEALTEYLNNVHKINQLVEHFLVDHQQFIEREDLDAIITPDTSNFDHLTIGPIPTHELKSAHQNTELAAMLPTLKQAFEYPKVAYLHSDVDTLDRSDILDDLRKGTYDVVVGINLLREGLDLPEVTLVAILDADKEGFLRSTTSMIQTMGRAARHVEGHVVMYADRFTKSMAAAISETYRRRQIQLAYNQQHGITPQTIIKEIKKQMVKREPKKDPSEIAPVKKSLIALTKEDNLDLTTFDPEVLTPHEKTQLGKKIRRRMKEAANMLDYELAALLRDTLQKLET
jgi:excinuclease ABC subunit B